MKSDTLKNFIIIGMMLAIVSVAPGCTKKGAKANAMAGGGAGSEDMMQPGGGIGGQPLTEQQMQEGQRDATYSETAALRDVFFDFDRSDLREDSRAAIDANAGWMKNNPGMKVQIEGHCDERGTEEYNLALGERRASAVKNYLVSLGVDSRRLYTISYGEELPVDPGHSEEAWSKNRRAHFVATDVNF